VAINDPSVIRTLGVQTKGCTVGTNV
jgi:hypothetical protein